MDTSRPKPETKERENNRTKHPSLTYLSVSVPELGVHEIIPGLGVAPWVGMRPSTSATTRMIVVGSQCWWWGGSRLGLSAQ